MPDMIDGETQDGSCSLGMSVNAAEVQAVSEIAELRKELERLRAQQREIMQLLGTKMPERVIHDLRNLLQERIFLEAAARPSKRG